MTVLSCNTPGTNNPQPCQPALTSTATSTALPTEFALEGNTPNPFRRQTQIQFALPEAAEVEIMVYDLMGRQVERLGGSKLPPGFHHVTMNTSELSSGVYLYRMRAGNFSDTGR